MMSKRSRTIALDAMGSDYGPASLVEGALLAIERGPHNVILVGQEPLLRRLLLERGHNPAASARIQIVDAPGVAAMDEPPREALRRKDTSIYIASELAREGKADGLVSAGNTGATMAITKLRWRALEGVSRPAIAAVLPAPDQALILLDVGANVDCRPQHLLHFAVMGSVYAKEILHRERPRVGLLSIGEEQSKGNALTDATFGLLQKTRLNFIGNVEGRDILNASCDVVVCDGFVGNIVLKFGEALAENLLTHLRGRLKSSFVASLAALAIRPTFRKFKEQLDPDEFGGAPLLGVNGVCIICHGATNPKAIMNAIRVAGESVEQSVNHHIIEEIRALPPLTPADCGN